MTTIPIKLTLGSSTLRWEDTKQPLSPSLSCWKF